MTTPQPAKQIPSMTVGDSAPSLTEEVKNINKGGNHTFYIGENKHIKIINKVQNLLLTIKNRKGAGKVSLVDEVKDAENVVHHITIERDDKNAPPRKLRASKAGTYDITLKHPGQLSSVEIGTKPRMTLRYGATEPMTPQDRAIFLMASLHDNVTIPEAKEWDDKTFDKFMNSVMQKGGIAVNGKQKVAINLDSVFQYFASQGDKFPDIPANFADGFARELLHLQGKGYQISPMKATSKEAKKLFEKVNLSFKKLKASQKQPVERLSTPTSAGDVTVRTTKEPEIPQAVRTYIQSVQQALTKKRGSQKFIGEVIQGLLNGGVQVKIRDKKKELVLYPDRVLENNYDQRIMQKLADILYEACPKGYSIRPTIKRQRSPFAEQVQKVNAKRVVDRVLAQFTERGSR